MITMDRLITIYLISFTFDHTVLEIIIKQNNTEGIKVDQQSMSKDYVLFLLFGRIHIEHNI